MKNKTHILHKIFFCYICVLLLSLTKSFLYSYKFFNLIVHFLARPRKRTKRTALGGWTPETLFRAPKKFVRCTDFLGKRSNDGAGELFGEQPKMSKAQCIATR